MVLTRSLYSGLYGILGFNLDTWVANVLDNTELNRKVIPPLTHADEIEILLYCSESEKKYPIRITTNKINTILTLALHPSKSIQMVFIDFAGDINRSTSGYRFTPIQKEGTTDVLLHHETRMSDDCFTVENRVEDSPNMVLETHFRNGQTMDAFVTRLREYINNDATGGMMLVVGIKLYPRLADGTFVAIAFLLERDFNLQLMRRPGPHI